MKRVTKLTYRIPGSQQLAVRQFEAARNVNIQPTFTEIVTQDGSQFIVQASQLVHIETFETDDQEKETDDNSQQEGQGAEAPADGEGPVTEVSEEA